MHIEPQYVEVSRRLAMVNMTSSIRFFRGSPLLATDCLPTTTNRRPWFIITPFSDNGSM
jgi:hypothetical protein